MEHDELETRIKLVMASQLYGVLSTQGEGGLPHCSIIAFASADDLGSIIFATPKNTRKHRNMLARTGVAFFVDDRRENREDLMQVVGIEATGQAIELTGDEKQAYRSILVAKNPQMAGFVDSPGSALIRIAVKEYDVVDHFQHVLVLPVDGSGSRTVDKATNGPVTRTGGKPA
jgi:heme iron utilization protein